MVILRGKIAASVGLAVERRLEGFPILESDEEGKLVERLRIRLVAGHKMRPRIFQCCGS